MEKIIIGLREKVVIYGEGKGLRVSARIDTGATKSSIDEDLAKRRNLGPPIKTSIVKSAHGTKRRPVIKAKIKIQGKILSSEFTIADRKHMKYKVLIGQNILKQGFLIDPLKEPGG